jgi:hypothetical protein
MRPDSLAAAGAVAALALAAVAQLASGSRGVDALVIAGYLAASAVFALSTARVVDTPEDAVRVDTAQRARVLAVSGVAAAVLLGIAAHVVVFDSLEAQAPSVLGPLLWAASVIVLLATATVVRPLPTWPAAWKPDAWPASPRRQRVLLGVIAALLVAAAATRLVALDTVPLGISADEGDRAASALSLLSGDAPRNLFASGWYYISNVYFWLLAGVMKTFGVGYVQARLLGAISGWLTFLVVVWIAFRHFGHRMALLTAVLGTALGVMLQFSRETTEAAPTALCWALSVAFLLEAARTGGTWPWVAAGIVGGLSLYFYPGGRLWLVLAAVVCVYVVVRAGPARRWAALAGAASTGLAALLTLGPFLANVRLHPGEFALRARQVSIFSDDNASRLSYYQPDWNTVQLVWAQLKHSFGIFASAGDAGGFWPTDRPILGPALTLLVAVGLGWFTLSWRHVPRFTIALWFWLGFAGTVVTVETPNLQRMATAVPVLPLLAAGVLDASAARVRGWTRRVVPEWDAGGLVISGFVVIVAGALAVQQAHFYFVTYADMERWPEPTIQGRAVADQRGALVMTLGRQTDRINSGWVRLLAPHTDRATIPSPGSQLPLAISPTRDLAFVLYPDQGPYLPFLRDIYPGGSVKEYRDPTEGLVVTVYRVPRARVAAQQGSLAIVSEGSVQHVSRLGSPPFGTRRPRRFRWTALVRVPQYWNYRLRVGAGPARLRIDGRTVLTVPSARSSATAIVALARGSHLVTLDGTASGRRAPSVEWSVPAGGRPLAPPGFDRWRAPHTGQLVADGTARGLVARVAGTGMHAQQRIDAALAMCCLTSDVRPQRGQYVVHWSGTLKAPRTGDYEMTLFTEGAATLRIDGRVVLRARPGETNERFRVSLRAGRHAVSLRYRVAGAGGALEWRWKPPSKPESIVPPSALEPPQGAGVSLPLAPEVLGWQPADVRLVVKRR